MPSYKLQKKSEHGRRVAVRPDYIEVHVPALIVCVLLALGIWFYIVNFTEDRTIAGGEGTTAVETVASPETEGEATE